MSEEELDESLRRFYAEARTKTGEEYCMSSLLGFCNSVERYFKSNNRSLKLSVIQLSAVATKCWRVN